MGEAMNIKAWLVVAGDGFEAVFIDYAAAERYASRCHGIIVPLTPANGPA